MPSPAAAPPATPAQALAAPASTKLVPPRPSGRLVAREQLTALLLEARRRRCIVLQGPAGCGKTTALVAWRQALLPLGFDVAWLTLAPEDNEPNRFLDYLLASLAQVDPAIARGATELAGHGVDAEAVERTVIALIRGLARHPRELVLVLDDLQHLGDVRIHAALQWLLDYAPPRLHLVLASRSAVPLSLARLRAQQLVLELDLRELRFSAAESERFLQAQLGQIAPRDAARLHELTDGWVAGLQLLALDLKKRLPKGGAKGTAAPGAPMRVPVQDAQAFAAYFEREVLARLAPNELELLISVSACNLFSAPLCAALAGKPDAVAEMVALLARLDADNLFIVPVQGADSETWYRQHPLLRETLRERLGRRSEARRRAVHLAAWQWFQARGLLDEAVHHAVQAGELQAAAALVEASARRLAPRGELRKLIALVRQLPPEQVRASPTLRLWMVRVALYARDFDACASGIAELRAELPADDGIGHFSLLLLEVTFAVQRDDLDAASAMQPRLLQGPPPGADAMMLGGRDNLLSWLYLRRGEHERARQVQLDNPTRLLRGVPLLGTAGGILQGRCLIGLSYALQGRMTEAERTYRDVLHEAQQGGSACIEPAYMATALLGEVLYESGDAQAVVDLLDERADVLERVSIPDVVLRLQCMRSAAHWLLGHRLESFACLERLEDYAAQLGLDRLLAFSLLAQSQRRLQLGELGEAEALMQRAEAIERSHPSKQPGQFNEIRVMAERARIRLQLSQGDFDGAVQRLDVLLASLEARRQLRLLPQLQLLRALTERARGREAQVREAVLAALRAGHRLGLGQSLLDADPAAPALVREAAQDPQLDPVLAFYVERLCPPPGDAAPPPEASGAPATRAPALPVESLSDRETDVVRLLAQAMPNKKIARALGLSPETVKWHLKNIYGKLGVAGRDEAVARVRDLRWGDPPG
ncbi:MAG: LuxR C-terminal-related transcriptional regulator [Comamonas sp.]